MHATKAIRFAVLTLGLAAGLSGTTPATRAAESCVERVVVFEMLGCPHCAATREFLDANKIPFQRIEAYRNPEVQAFMTQQFGSTAVPVILNGKKAMRGFSEDGLRKLLCLG
jgi:glutaredoxin